MERSPKEPRETVLHIPILQTVAPRPPIGAPAAPFRLGQALKQVSWWVMVAMYGFVLYASARRVNFMLATVDTKYDVAGTLGGAFMIMTVPLATYQAVLHLTNFVEPRQQSNTVRIIFMLHVYSVSAFLSLRYTRWSLFIACVRELYEAYVIYCFLHYLVCYLGEEQRCQTRLAHKPSIVGHHKPPFCCLSPWHMEREFLERCKQGVFQYVFIRIISTVVALYLQFLHLYSEGDFDPKRGYFWITVVTCLSQTWALYVLVLFYNATQKDLGHIHAMGKFLAIKAVVFFSWWQGLLIELLEHHGHIEGVGHHPAEHVAQGIQDLLICMEMFVAAIVFFYAFPLSDYVRAPTAAEAAAAAAMERADRSESRSAQRERGLGHGGGGNGGGVGDSAAALLLPPAGGAAAGGRHKGNGARLALASSKSNPRLDRLWDPAATRQLHHPPSSVWYALRASVLPLELQEDVREAVQKLQEKLHAFCSRRKRDRARSKLADSSGHSSPVMMTL